MIDRVAINIRHVRSRAWRWRQASAPTWRQLARATGEKMLAFVRWLWTILLAPVYISFEVYMATWAFWVRRTNINAGLQSDGWQRGLFCLVLSLTLGQGILLTLTRMPCSTWSFLVCGMHGVAVHVLWKRGQRWCRQQLGIRPTRSANPNKPWDALDFGN